MAQEQYPSIFRKSFKNESERIEYKIFVGPHSPQADVGNIGDIGVESSDTQEVTDILNFQRTIERPKNYEKHQVYYKTEDGWRYADKRRHDNGKPYTRHPEISLYFLDDFSFTWRNARNYSANSKRRTSKRLDSTSGGGDHDAVEPSHDGDSQKAKKRARTDSMTFDRSTPSWIMEEYHRWQSKDITDAAHPTLHEQGRKILSKLVTALSRSSESVPSWPHGPELKHIIIIHAQSTGHLSKGDSDKPDMSHVITDLSEARRNGNHASIVNFLRNGPANHTPIEKLLKLFPLSGDSSGEKVLPIGALTIPASSSGLDKVNLLPNLVEDCTEFVCERKTEKKKSDHPWAWASCLVPIGAITTPHTDYCGSSQLIQHINGRKLWLCWPPTPSNLDIYVREHFSGLITFSTEDAIDRLEGLELLLLDDEQTRFILPGGTIHAVLTFSQSCHTGLKLCRIGDLDVARKMYKIESENMNEELDDNMFEHLQDYFKDVKEELKLWGELRKKSKNKEVNEVIDEEDRSTRERVHSMSRCNSLPIAI
ncbi:hypothetical protein F5887DRAFT_1245073 [Amanita rubescens]|nr:hypothetical protein F5887DRAFT_1245073 [Amanita rubescens]